MRSNQQQEALYSMIRHLADRLTALGVAPDLGPNPNESWQRIASQLIGEGRRIHDKVEGKKLIHIQIRKSGAVKIVTPSGEVVREEPKRPNNGRVRTLKMQSRALGWIAIAILYKKGYRMNHEYGWWVLARELQPEEWPAFPLPVRELRSYDFGSALMHLEHAGVAKREINHRSPTTRWMTEIFDGLDFSITSE